MKLSEFERDRRGWARNFEHPPALPLSRLSLIAIEIGKAQPENRRTLFSLALIYLLDAAYRVGLEVSELQTYRFKTAPGWRTALRTLHELKDDHLNHETFSTAFCCLWHCASSCKVWRQDVIRGAAAALKTLQLEEISR